MPSVHTMRLRKLRRAMQRRRLSAVYLNSSPSRYYLTGFTGTAGALLVTARGHASFFTDFRYIERAQNEIAPDFVITEVERSALPLMTRLLLKERINKLGFEDREMTAANALALQRKIKKCSLAGIGDTLEIIRAQKDDIELQALRQAIKATDDVFATLRRWLRGAHRAKRLPSEALVSWKVRDIIHTKRLGELSFETIIASGPNAARPHHEPTARKLSDGEMVIIDLGVKVGGYHADMTRTIFLGAPTKKQKDIYNTTLKAQSTAISYLKRGGRSALAADRSARAVIDKKFPGAFGHSLGHGVGLKIHEHPTLAPKSKDILKPGMIFSIEPGVYLPGEGGVRIEDLVLLKGKGVEVLSQSPKSLSKMII